ncbi:outer membrane protein transport protein, partial [Klebsiella pneumoniae]|uniref:outer membrane protein transport protein n=1 Tax=Klebsiella pneumoniae TaxID=573 RepID=UPI00272F8097
PGLNLYPNGAKASTQLDIPATAAFDWVHQFDDRLTVGASVMWTQWSSFQDLTLKSEGYTIVSIPYKRWRSPHRLPGEFCRLRQYG